ncbi:MAG TPA: MFS transporter [Silvibacterium sp.]|nr:MFS transporter [Silvibacterium sp.]
MPYPQQAAAVDPARVMRRIFWRLIPFLFLLYVCAYLDRVNLSFAALSMQRELALSGTVYGIGAGLFFVSYALFEVPANLILLRLGPRRWIATIMIAWGVISAGMALIQSPASFYLLRFFLGAAEAGFFPGIILFLTYWFPRAQRARAIARFMSASAVAGLIGAPLSIYLLRLNGVAHISGWRWLFLGEGLPSVLLGIVVLFVLVDRPEDATWLSPAERQWLQNELAGSYAASIANSTAPTRLTQAFRQPTLWMLASIYFANSVGTYSITLWLPIVVKSLTHAADLRVITLTTIPYLLAVVAMLLVARSSDKSGERKWHLCACLIASALAFFISAVVANPILGLAALFFTAAGTWGIYGPFWSLPTTIFRGAAAAGGIALINSIGALGGFFGPYLMGRVSDLTHNFRAALLVASALLILAAAVASRLKVATPAAPQ